MNLNKPDVTEEIVECQSDASKAIRESSNHSRADNTPDTVDEADEMADNGAPGRILELPDEVLERIVYFCFPSVGPTYVESVREIGRIMTICKRYVGIVLVLCDIDV